MLKATERLHWLTPEKFAAASREEQVLLLVYTQERDLEEVERSGSLAVGRMLTKPGGKRRGES